MDLEILKSNWKVENQQYSSFSQEDIKKMISFRSKSLTRKIVVISAMEFIFWFGLNIYSTLISTYEFTKSSISNMIPYFEILNYLILLIFIFRFFYYLKLVQNIDSVKDLMKSILKVRRTARSYIFYNISIFFSLSILLFINELLYNNEIIEKIKINGSLEILILIFLYVFIMAIAIIIIYVVYNQIYGKILKRLMENYNDLKRL